MTATLVIGIDPDASGAIAFLTPAGELLAVEDMPMDTVQVGKHSRSRTAVPRLLALLKDAAGAHAFVERPTFRPMKRRDPATGVVTEVSMGVAGAGAMGEKYGCVITALAASGAALTEVRPGVWGAAIGLKGGKDDARRMAANLFPAHAERFARVKDDGRADAALIGYYGARQLRGDRRVA